MVAEVAFNVMVAILVALLSYFAKSIWQMVSGVVQGLFGDLPYIKGTWLATYTEPKEDLTLNKAQESITLNQIGRFIWGEARVTDSDERVFVLKAHLIGATLIGTQRRKGRRKAVGTGAFQLRVAGHENAMKGYCTWHDYDTDRIESSEYIWTRQ
jgi:hypothetical protein